MTAVVISSHICSPQRSFQYARRAQELLTDRKALPNFTIIECQPTLRPIWSVQSASEVPPVDSSGISTLKSRQSTPPPAKVNWLGFLADKPRGPASICIGVGSSGLRRALVWMSTREMYIQTGEEWGTQERLRQGQNKKSSCHRGMELLSEVLSITQKSCTSKGVIVDQLWGVVYLTSPLRI